MNNISIIIPVHKINNEFYDYFDKAIESVEKNTSYANLTTIVVCPPDVAKELDTSKYKIKINILTNEGKSDFCSQINFAVNNIDTDLFSILEYDDEYTNTWFKSFDMYYNTNEDVSVFLPINVQHSPDRTKWQFGNEIVWASSFSNEIGYIDFDCLQNCSTFNLTGGVFNTDDFKKIGMLKPSIKVSFNYEFLLRLTNNKLKAFVIPKEGYIHVIGREDSLTDIYEKSITDDEIQKWFELAVREYVYIEDRGKDIIRNVETVK